MASARIYAKDVPFSFHHSVVDLARQASAAAALTSMAAFVTTQNLPDLQPIFNLIDSVMFFEVDIPNGPYIMNRSFTDLPSRQFNWMLSEFLDPNHRDCSRATYYFYDAFHIHQFTAAGGVYPADHPTQAQWEVDAITEQVATVKALACGQYLADFLGNFDHSYDQVLARLEQGVAVGACGRPGGVAVAA